MTDLRIPRATGRGQAPAIAVPAPRQPVDPLVVDAPPPDSDGVELGRLLRLAGLTPEQAVEVAAGLLAAVAGRSDPGTGGDEVIVDQVALGSDGRVVLRPVRDVGVGGGDGDTPTARPAGVAVGAVLGDIARAARLRAGRTGPDADPLLGHLDAAVAEVSLAGVPAAARTLTEAAAGTDRSAVRAELGALVRAIGGSAARGQGTGSVAVPSAAIRRGQAPPAAARGRRNARRRIGAWLLSILVLAGAVLLEKAVLGDKVATDIGVLLDAGRSGSTPSAAPPKPDGLPVVPPAPAAAGSVRGVDLRPLGGCTPGGPCEVRVLVRVVPGPAAQVVTWSFRIVDRCTGAVVPVPGGTVSVPAGQERIALVGTVALPTAPAVGLVAVTEVPAVAASAPVLFGSCRPAAG